MIQITVSCINTLKTFNDKGCRFYISVYVYWAWSPIPETCWQLCCAAMLCCIVQTAIYNLRFAVCSKNYILWSVNVIYDCAQIKNENKKQNKKQKNPKRKHFASYIRSEPHSEPGLWRNATDIMNTQRSLRPIILISELLIDFTVSDLWMCPQFPSERF